MILIFANNTQDSADMTAYDAKAFTLLNMYSKNSIS